MALYWPQYGLAVEVVDDPDSEPFTGDEDVEVISVTTDELADPALNEDLCERVMKAAGRTMPENEEERSRALQALVRESQTG